MLDRVGEAESVAEPGLLRAHEAPRARSVALGACGQGGKGEMKLSIAYFET